MRENSTRVGQKGLVDSLSTLWRRSAKYRRLSRVEIGSKKLSTNLLLLGIFTIKPRGHGECDDISSDSDFRILDDEPTNLKSQHDLHNEGSPTSPSKSAVHGWSQHTPNVAAQVKSRPVAANADGSARSRALPRPCRPGVAGGAAPCPAILRPTERSSRACGRSRT